MSLWTIKLLNKASQCLATLILPWDKYSYQCLAIRLSISPNIYQEKMSSLFTNTENVICFIDDIASITNGSFDLHLQQLDAVLQCLNDNNLQVNGIKSSFCVHKAEFLGFVLTCQGVHPQVNKVEAVMKILPPLNVKQVHSFISMINYYKDHIPHCSELLSPLTSLTKKNAKFSWSPDCQSSFK